MDPVLLEYVNLMNHISQIEFEEGPPLYMGEVKAPSESILDSRFTMEALQSLYKQFRKNMADRTLMDEQTFITLIVVNMQAGVLPNTWRFISFESIKELINRFKATPMSDNANQTGQVALFRRRSSPGINEREFIDWRKVFTVLLLISGPCPTNNQKREYFQQLRESADEAGLLSLHRFLKVSGCQII